MSKILTVFGATGHQGSSVVHHVLGDPELSQRYKIRAITRDLSSPKAQALAEQVEVVQADVTDRASLEKALSGAHTVFAMTTPHFGPNGFEVEYNDDKRIADVAVEVGVDYIIFSTLPPVSEISGGKYTQVYMFDAKAKVEQYIRGLPIKSAFYSPGNFMENFHTQPFLAPRPAGDGTWVVSRNMSPHAKMALVDAVGDGGKFIGAILEDPDKYQGKTFCAAEGHYSMEQIATAISKSTGQTVKYKQISDEDFRQSLPVIPEVFVEGFKYGEEFGYWGPESEQLVSWARENARGKLSTLDEFFERHPLKLE